MELVEPGLWDACPPPREARPHGAVTWSGYQAAALALIVAVLTGCGTEPARRSVSTDAHPPLPGTGVLRQELVADPAPWRVIRVAVAAGDSVERTRLLAAWLDTLHAVPSHPRARYGIGVVMLASGDDSAALAYLRAVTASYPGDALCWAYLAEAARRRGALPEIAAETRNAGSDQPYAATRLLGRGLLLAEAAAWDSTLACAEQAVALAPNWGEPCLLMARAVRGMGRYGEALRHTEHAVSLAMASSDPELHVRSLDALCIVRRLLGDTAGAAAAGLEALQLCTGYGLPHLEAPVRCELAYLRLLQGDAAGAEAMLAIAATVAARAGDRRAQGWALKLRGDALARLGDLSGAETTLDTAMRALRLVHDPEGPAACLDALGGIAARRGRPDLAIARYEDARTLHVTLGHQSAEAATASNLGSVLLDHGEPGRALGLFHRSVSLAETLGDSLGIATGSIGLANAYMAIGDHARAEDAVQRALVVGTTLRDTATVAAARGSLGGLEFRRARRAEAREHFLAAAILFERLGDGKSTAAALLNAGMALGGDDQPLAEQTIQNARAVAAECADRHGQALASAALGEVTLRAGRPVEAATLFAESLQQATMSEAPELVWFTRYGLARCHEDAGDWRKALAMYDAAAVAIEDSRAMLSVQEWRFGFLASKMEVYERFVGLLAVLHEQDPAAGFSHRAFVAAERAKARSFLDLLGAAGGREVHGHSSRAALVREISRLSGLIWHEARDSPRADSLRREAAAREDELNRLRARGEACGSPEWATLADPCRSFQAAMRRHGVAVLLEYFVGERQSFLWEVSPDSVAMRRLPSRARVAEMVGRLLAETAQSPRLGARCDEEGQRLAATILPAGGLGASPGLRICIVPDGPLLAIPFEALPAAPDSARPLLIETHVVSYAPSATSLLALWRQGDRGGEPSVLAVGIRDSRGVAETRPPSAGPGGASAVSGFSPPSSRSLPLLRWAEAEAESVCVSFDAGRCTMLIGGEANEGRVVSELQRPHGIAHFATHSLIDVQAPRRSCIVLTPGPDPGDDGMLVLDEILQLASSPAFMVLSSCESAMGEPVPGEGMVSLARAFFHAGSQAVLVSLWPVNDRSTAQWMKEFYRGLASGATRAEAARQAKLSFLHGEVPALRHPYYWAPFVLVGRN
ncbi:CHAT domain-containing protein [Candidatus Fermentibacteria bacterium]|nr:CHAT domain-containing protein [Candidatus Fermentibacteria bacterium]